MNKTLAQMITGSGRAAVASILVVGQDAESIIQECFFPASKVQQLITNRIYFGQWVWQQYREDLVVTRASETTFEIHCHGGNLAAQTILKSLVAQGTQVAGSDRWLLDPSLDRFSAEASALLPSAITLKTAAILLDQSRRAIVKTLGHVRQCLSRSQIDQAKDALKQMLAFAPLGQRLVTGFEVVLIGEPNTGKSSLVNAILGFERTIVYDQPGTTRDLIATGTAIQGWPVTFVDTAGLRSTHNRVESLGIEKARQRVGQADLVLEIHDPSNPFSTRPLLDSSQNPPAAKTPTIRVGTKADLIKTLPTNPISNDWPLRQAAIEITTSSVTGFGIDELRKTIVDRLVPTHPSQGQAIPVSDWQSNVLRKLLSLLDQRSSVHTVNELIAELSIPETEFLSSPSRDR